MRHLLLGALILVGACGGSARAPAPKNVIAAPPAATDYAKLLTDPLAFLPIDAEVVLSVDFAQVRRSPLWRTYGPRLLASSEGWLARIKAECNIDVVREVSGMRLAMRKPGTKETDGVLVVRGFEREPLMACTEKTSKKVTRDGELLIGRDGDDTFVMQFVDPTTLVAQIGPQTTKASFRAVLASGSPLRNSPVFSEMFGKLDAQAAAWFLFNGNGELFKNTGLQIKGMYGSVGLKDGLTASGRVRFPDAAQAAQVTQMAQAQIAGFSSMVTRLDLAADQAEMTVELAMTEQQVSSILSMFTGMLGGGGGPTSPVPPFVPRSN